MDSPTRKRKLLRPRKIDEKNKDIGKKVFTYEPYHKGEGLTQRTKKTQNSLHNLSDVFLFAYLLGDSSII